MEKWKQAFSNSFFPHRFLPREPSKKRLKDDQVAKTTSSMSSIYKSKEKRPSTASQTQEAPINPGTKKNTLLYSVL